MVRAGVLAVLVYLAWSLTRLWDETPVDFSDFRPPLLVAACVASVVAVVSYGAVWPVILRRLGAGVPRGALGIFLQSQLGKYLPGSIWHYAGRVGLAKAGGVPARLGIASLGIEVTASVIAAAIVGCFVLPFALALALAVTAVALLTAFATGRAPTVTAMAGPVVRLMERTLRMPSGAGGRALRVAPGIVALYVPVWVLYGVAFWLTARAVFPIPAEDIVFYTAAFALGWLAGMVVVFAPGGIGVREAVLVSLLAPRIGHGDAIVVAGVSRLLLTGADVACGAVAVTISRVDRRIRVPRSKELESGRAQPS